ncbi:unnamed protein product [Cylindrotheca closterium]|uniref:SAM-dependent MTase RsmB/NOP-type domain-containing protein n=1 Tax=Cylindrotheca closterium TaxID=2856 RepID=A0AAD2CIS9_9STRA|nr:unnamed protein product [Cylindrotheca closterium]
MSSSPYAPAGNILNQIIKTKKGLKAVAYNKDGELTCSKTAYAQSSHVLQHKPLLDKILREVPVDANNKGLLYILLYELLMGPNRAIRGGGALKRQLLKQQEQLQATLFRLQPSFANMTASSPDQSSSDYVTIPRYVRVNTIVSSMEQVLSQIDAKTKPSKNNKNKKKTKKPSLQDSSSSSKMPRYVDPHVPNVLVFPPTASTRANLQELVKSQQVVLQDKSSCFSALCMVHGFDTLPSMEGDFLDACAAPGNKTCHLAALLTEQAAAAASTTTTTTSKSSSSKRASSVVVHALDKSKDRFELLQRRMKELTETPPRDGDAKKNKVTTVECHNADFLSIDPETDETFSNVTAIMLDPSCSGSGMISNHQEAMDRDPLSKPKNFDRIESLSNFQFQALQHATSAFPKVQRVVYSTCSVYVQENEGVVQRLLESSSSSSSSSNDGNDGGEWELVAPKCLDHWHRRGLEHPDVVGLSPEQLQCLIRVNPEEDGTNGFFVACLQRKAANKAPKKKKKKMIGAKKNTYEKPLATMGMELYDNQFNKDDNSTGKEEKEETSTVLSSSAVTTMSNQKSSGKMKNDDDSSSKKKRKAEGDKEGDEEESNIVSKKRAKKMEWKKKQREKKLLRLAKQEQQANNSSEQ